MTCYLSPEALCFPLTIFFPFFSFFSNWLIGKHAHTLAILRDRLICGGGGGGVREGLGVGIERNFLETFKLESKTLNLTLQLPVCSWIYFGLFYRFGPL